MEKTEEDAAPIADAGSIAIAVLDPQRSSSPVEAVDDENDEEHAAVDRGAVIVVETGSLACPSPVDNENSEVNVAETTPSYNGLCSTASVNESKEDTETDIAVADNASVSAAGTGSQPFSHVNNECIDQIQTEEPLVTIAQPPLPVCTPPLMSEVEHEITDDVEHAEIGSQQVWCNMAVTPPLLTEADEDFADEDFVFIKQSSRRLRIPESLRQPVNQSLVPSAPPLHLLGGFDSYSNNYAYVLQANPDDLNPTPLNDEIFRIMTDFEGSQALLDGVLVRIRSIRETIEGLSKEAWHLELKMLIAEENGDVKAVPFEREISWTSRLVESVKRKFQSLSGEDESKDNSPEGSILVASLVPTLMKEREAKKTELRAIVDELVDRAFVASLRRHRAVECVRSVLNDRGALKATCDSLMHYENRDRDVCLVSKAIRQLLAWVISCLLEGENDDVERLRNQVWLIRRAKIHALKIPPKTLSRINENIENKGTTAQWAHHDWIDRWMTVLEAIVERGTVDPSTALAKSVSGLKEPRDLQSTMVVHEQQDEEVLVALLSNFPFELGLRRLTSSEYLDIPRLMSRTWQLIETLGEACVYSKVSCPRFSAELASRLCSLTNALSPLLDKGLPQMFYDRSVLQTLIFLLDRGSVFDISSSLKHVSDAAAWLMFTATMSFLNTKDEIDQTLVGIPSTDNDIDDLFLDLDDYNIESEPKQGILACGLADWLRLAPAVRGNFSNPETHLARCTFLSKLAKFSGKVLAAAITREMLGLAYIAGYVPCEVVNPLVCEIVQAQSFVCSIVIHVVALNDGAFFKPYNSSVQELLNSMSFIDWEPRGEADLRFFRDWLGRDPADPRALIACDILERLNLPSLPLDVARSIARTLAIVSATDPVNTQSAESLIYQKTLRPLRKSRLIDRFWDIILRLRLDAHLESPSPRSRDTLDKGDTVDSDVEFLQLTFKRNPSQPLLAFVVGITCSDSECLDIILGTNRAQAIWQLSRVLSRTIINHTSRTEFEDAVRQTRIDAIRRAMQYDQKGFVQEVTRAELSSTVSGHPFRAIRPWLEIAADSDAVFVDCLLRLVKGFDVDMMDLSRFRAYTTKTTVRLNIQFLLERTRKEMALWFGLGRVLLDACQALSLEDLFSNADRVLPDLLTLAGVRDSYVSPRSLVFFDWVDQILFLDRQEDAENYFGIMAQCLFSLLFSTAEGRRFGQMLWHIAPKKRTLLKGKLKELAHGFHSAASDPAIDIATRTSLVVLGEIAHEGNEHWLDEYPSFGVSSAFETTIIFSERSPHIAYDRLLLPPEFRSNRLTKTRVSDLHGSPSNGSLSRPTSQSPLSKTVVSSSAVGLGSSNFLTQFSGLAPNISPNRRSLVSLLRRAAASIHDSRVRLKELDMQETQQFSSKYRTRPKTCPVLVDRLYSGDAVKHEVALSGGKKKKSNHTSTMKRAQVTQATWTVFEVDDAMVAAQKATAAQIQAEFDSLYSRFSPSSASDELCASLQVAHQLFAEDRPECEQFLRELLEFNSAQLCACTALRNAWVEVIAAGMTWAASKDLHGEMNMFLLDTMLRQPWSIRHLHHLLNIDGPHVVEALDRFCSHFMTLETIDALALLKRLETANLENNSDVDQILTMVLRIFGKRNCDVKVMDQLKRGLLRMTLSRHLRAHPMGLRNVIRALVSGNEDGGPLPPMVWAEVSSVPDSIWRNIPEHLAQVVMEDISVAFSRVPDRHGLISSWVALSPNLCRRAKALKSIIQPWSPWVLSATNDSTGPHPHEEDALVNCFVTCIQRLLEDLESSPIDVSTVLLDTWLWFVQAVCASRTSVVLVKGLMRLPWGRMTVSTYRADEFVTSLERLANHVTGLPSRPSDEATMSLLHSVLEQSQFACAPYSAFPEDLLGRAFSLGVILATESRVHRLFFCLPFEHLGVADFTAGLNLCILDIPGSKDVSECDSRVSARVGFVLAVAGQYRQAKAQYKRMEFAIAVNRFAFTSLIQSTLLSYTVCIKLFHACMVLVRSSFADLNGDLESCVVREMLSFLRAESDQVTGFCLSKMITSGLVNVEEESSSSLASAKLTNSVGYISVVARSFLPTFLKQDVSSAERGLPCEESWTEDWKHIYTNLVGQVCRLTLSRKGNPALAGCGLIIRLFASGSSFAGLFAREASTMTQIQERALARILNELGQFYDLCDLAERCETIASSAVATGSAIVLTAALHGRTSGFDRVAAGSTYVASLDFRVSGRDVFFLLSEIARNLSSSDSSSLSRSFKIDRAMFLSSRLEQVMPTLENPRQRLATAACADAFRFCCSKIDLHFSAIDNSGLRGPEVDWVRANGLIVDFESLYKFVDGLRFLLWPDTVNFATKLTEITGGLGQTETDDGEVVAL